METLSPGRRYEREGLHPGGCAEFYFSRVCAVNRERLMPE